MELIIKFTENDIKEIGIAISKIFYAQHNNPYKEVDVDG